VRSMLRGKIVEVDGRLVVRIGTTQIDVDDDVRAIVAGEVDRARADQLRVIADLRDERDLAAAKYLEIERIVLAGMRISSPPVG